MATLVRLMLLWHCIARPVGATRAARVLVGDCVATLWAPVINIKSSTGILRTTASDIIYHAKSAAFLQIHPDFLVAPWTRAIRRLNGGRSTQQIP